MFKNAQLISFRDMTHYLLSVPVKAHVYKFLKYHFPSPYELSEGDFIGPMLLQMLRRPERHQFSQELVAQYPERWSVRVSYSLFHERRAFELGGRNILSFNTFVDQLMKLMLFEEVNKLYDLEYQKKNTILEFMARYEIGESEMSFDAWKKAVQRIGYRKKSQKTL